MHKNTPIHEDETFQNTNNENKQKAPSTTQDYFELMLDKIIKYAKNNFKNFTNSFTLIFAVLSIAINALYSVQIAGRFSVYGIDNSYISLSSTTLLINISFSIGLMLFICPSNLYVYTLITSQYNKNSFIIKLFRFILLIFVEIIIAFTYVLIHSRSSLNSLCITVKQLLQGDLKEVYISLFLLLIGVLYLNILGILYGFQEICTKKNVTKKHIKNKVKKTHFLLSEKVSIFLIILCLFLFGFCMFTFLAYNAGVSTENMRTEFKTVLIPSDNTQNQSEYIFNIDKKDYEVYPVVFENQDVYILSRIYAKDGIITIDKSYQKIIKKDGTYTITYPNIYKLTPSIGN